MNNTPSQSNSPIVDEIFAKLGQRDIEQFYAAYQRWHLQQQIATLQTRIDALQLQILENTEHMQEVHPSALSLATLARLQANGVSDIDLLDQMLERGESWLDQTMQRLDYCEQLDDFIRDDYTQWCNLALEGAYDWIDSIQEPIASSQAQEPIAIEEEVIETTEELLLQKLSSDEVEEVPASESQEDASPQESLSVEDAPVSGTRQPATQEYTVPASEVEVPASESTEPPPQSDTTLEEPISAESSPLSDSEQPAINEQPALQESVEATPATEEPSITSSPEPPSQIEEPAPPEVSPLDSEKHEANIRVSVPQVGAQHPQNTVVEKRPNFIIRLLKSLWR